MPLPKGLSQKPLLSLRRAWGKKFPSSANKKTETPGSKWNTVLLTISEGLSQDQIPHRASLPAYEAVGQQATKEADIITIETDVWPTYNLRCIGSTRGFGCGKLHTAEYEMVRAGCLCLNSGQECVFPARRELQVSVIHLAAELF